MKVKEGLSEEFRIPFVPRELCEFLRVRYDMQRSLDICRYSDKNADWQIGYLHGIDEVIRELEGIVRYQEGEGEIDI